MQQVLLPVAVILAGAAAIGLGMFRASCHQTKAGYWRTVSLGGVLVALVGYLILLF